MRANECTNVTNNGAGRNNEFIALKDTRPKRYAVIMEKTDTI